MMMMIVDARSNQFHIFATLILIVILMGIKMSTNNFTLLCYVISIAPIIFLTSFFSAMLMVTSNIKWLMLGNSFLFIIEISNLLIIWWWLCVCGWGLGGRKDINNKMFLFYTENCLTHKVDHYWVHQFFSWFTHKLLIKCNLILFY